MPDCQFEDARRSNSCSGFSDEEFEELRKTAEIYIDAFGLFIKITEKIRKFATRLVHQIPESVQEEFDELVYLALERAYGAALWRDLQVLKNIRGSIRYSPGPTAKRGTR